MSIFESRSWRPGLRCAASVVLFALGSAPAFAQTLDDAWEAFANASEQLQRGNRRDAIKQLESGLKILPSEVRLQMLLASTLELEGRDHDALVRWTLAARYASGQADRKVIEASMKRLSERLGKPMEPMPPAASPGEATGLVVASPAADAKPLPLTAEEAKRLYERASWEPYAVERLRKAAEDGQTLGRLSYGRLVEDGIGVPADISQAAQLYRKAADAGNSEARERYEALQDRLAAIRARREAEAKREREAQLAAARAREAERAQQEVNDLVNLFQAAKLGDPGKFAALKELASRGHADAQNFVGVCYLYGYGTGKDEVEATRWWVRSGRQGNPHAKKNLDMLRRAGYMVDIIERSTN